ncbi:MAG: class I SAM-dependent methyltransferase [Actinobacteria bacterium]|nr:class I SAM-dependent methyltransferase [Actinomycetota bacterium]
MKRRVLMLFRRFGLVGPAFRTYERAVALRPSRIRTVDGPPLPPRRLMVRVAGTADADWFLRGGRAAYDAIAAHISLDDANDVLDFGCGCGRVLRYWGAHDGTITGSDRDADAIAWCRGNLAFARLLRNGLEPPLDLPDEGLDLVYALSVFTHLTAGLQTAWRDELRRVVRPGGRLLLTVHGRSYLPRLSGEERASFDAGELVVRWGELPGSNLCSAYHPERYVRETLADGFEVETLEPEGALGNPTQDLIVLRRTVSASA